MNPAWSVIVFTTVAGAAQGLVVVLALAALAGAMPAFGRGALLLALAMLAVALGASFLHLGRPERAWRAAAMWRTSWLSREVIVLPAFAGSVALWWALGARTPAWWPLLCLLLSAGLWWCTAMIYACLRFIQEWAHPLTLAGFVMIGLSSGLVLCGALAVASGDAAFAQRCAPWALASTLAAWAVRAGALRRNAALRPVSTLQSATGIRSARVVQISMGMTGGAFNTREFFHRAGAAVLPRVRVGFQTLAFALPAALMAWALLSPSPWPWAVALLLQAPGLLAERWFFFAQARHPQNLYYQTVS